MRSHHFRVQLIQNQTVLVTFVFWLLCIARWGANTVGGNRKLRVRCRLRCRRTRPPYRLHEGFPPPKRPPKLRSNLDVSLSDLKRKRPSHIGWQPIWSSANRTERRCSLHASLGWTPFSVLTLAPVTTPGASFPSTVGIRSHLAPSGDEREPKLVMQCSLRRRTRCSHDPSPRKPGRKVLRGVAAQSGTRKATRDSSPHVTGGPETSQSEPRRREASSGLSCRTMSSYVAAATCTPHPPPRVATHPKPRLPRPAARRQASARLVPSGRGTTSRVSRSAPSPANKRRITTPSRPLSRIMGTSSLAFTMKMSSMVVPSFLRGWPTSSGARSHRCFNQRIRGERVKGHVVDHPSSTAMTIRTKSRARERFGAAGAKATGFRHPVGSINA